MPVYYHGGKDALDFKAMAKESSLGDEEQEGKILDQLQKHHPFTRPHRDNLVSQGGKLYIKKPGMYCRQLDQQGNPIPELVPWEAGSIAFGIAGYDFFVVPPGGSVVIDPSISEKVVKDAAPHLLTEAEAMERGIVKPVGAPPPAEPRKSKAALVQ